MNQVTRFKASDGKEFIEAGECLRYELLIEDVDKIMSHLPPKPDDTSFGNGHGYIQHDKGNLRAIQVRFLELCRSHVDHRWIQDTIDNEGVDPSWVARILGDYNIRPLSRAWYRFSCIDKLHREWGQPYFAINPDKGQQIKLNES